MAEGSPIFIYRDRYLFFRLEDGTCNIHQDVDEGVKLGLKSSDSPLEYYWRYVNREFKYSNQKIPPGQNLDDFVNKYFILLKLLEPIVDELKSGLAESRRIEKIEKDRRKYVSIKDVFSNDDSGTQPIDYRFVTKIIKPEFKIPNIKIGFGRLLAVHFFNILLSLVILAFLLTIFSLDKAYWQKGIIVLGIILSSLTVFISTEKLEQMEEKIVEYLKNSIRFTIFSIFDTIMVSNRIRKGVIYQAITGYVSIPLVLFTFGAIIGIFGIDPPKDAFFFKVLETIWRIYWINYIYIIVLLLVLYIFFLRNLKVEYLLGAFVGLYFIGRFLLTSKYLLVFSFLGVILSLHVFLAALIYPENQPDSKIKKLNLFSWIWQLVITSHFRIFSHLPYRILPGIIVMSVFSPIILLITLFNRIIGVKSTLLVIGFIISLSMYLTMG